jgi:uncharacterized protein (TIGR03435 family)
VQRLTAISRNSDTEPTDSSPSGFYALQDLLGLKLPSAKGMVERVMVDHID